MIMTGGFRSCWNVSKILVCGRLKFSFDKEIRGRRFDNDCMWVSGGFVEMLVDVKKMLVEM